MGLDLTKTGGGGWLTVGDHVVKVAGFENVTANKGSKGVEYQFVQESTGKKSKGTYWMYNKDGSPSNGAWRLRVLAEAAKLDNAAIRDFNPSMVVGRTVGITVAQDGKYHEVVGEFPPTAEDIAKSREAPAEGSDNQAPDSQAPDDNADRHDQSSEGESQGPVDYSDVPF